MSDPASKPKLYAILIGVDCYLPNKLPDGGSYPSLSGCVNDINQVETYLTKRLTVERIVKVTASGQAAEPTEVDTQQWPTKENIKRAFDSITTLAQTGDQVYIHYSGHGGRAKTCFADLKGNAGLDEALVPTDIGASASNYLRDLEIAYLLQKMVDKGLVVSVVLDSCHSGGSTRGSSGVRKRGISSTDMRVPDEAGLIAPKAELIRQWQALATGAAAPGRRSAKPDSGWLPEPQGYVLLAACGAAQLANEFPFDGAIPNGALTHWMLSSLNQLDGQLTYQMLYDRILGKITTQFSDQTPQLQGERNRVIFGIDQIPPKENRIRILKVETSSGNKPRLLLDAGPGLSAGAKFAIFPAATASAASEPQRAAIAELKSINPDGMTAWASVTDVLDRKAVLTEGAQALLIAPGSIQLLSTVRLLTRTDLPVGIDQKKALEAVANAIATSDEGWVNVSQEEAADFQVVLNEQNEYEIWDASGKAILLRPALKSADANAAASVAKRLVHLTRFNNVKQLSSDDDTSALAGKLRVELLKGDKANPQPFDNPNARVVRPGDKVTLKIRNERAKIANDLDANVLYVTILDLQPDWGISVLVKTKEINPGEEKLFSPTMSLPDQNVRSCVDTFKIIATSLPVDFSWLLLPALDTPPAPEQAKKGKVMRGGLGPLEQLFAKVATNAPATRTATLDDQASAEWVSAQVEVKTEAQS